MIRFLVNFVQRVSEQDIYGNRDLTFLAKTARLPQGDTAKRTF